MRSESSQPLSLHSIRVTDPFWAREIGLIRQAVIPYQWNALNDQIPDAAPSWWAHNMRAAARAVAAKKAGKLFIPAHHSDRIETLPEEGKKPQEDAFYGFVFQDSDGYKWLEAVSYQLMAKPDSALQAQAQKAVDMICAAQEEDGYLDTYYTLTGRERAFTYLRDHHELYCFGHLVEAAVAWHQATGKDDLLNAARRFGECISSKYGPDKERGCPGHEIAEMALMRMYEETGEEQWRDLAKFFLDVRGTEPSTFAQEENRRRAAKGLPELPVSAERYEYYQANMPVRDMKEAVGHAVRQMYLCSGMADEARLCDDAEMEAACDRLWQSVVREKLYITGGVGATHVGEAFSRPFDLPNDTAYSETCAAIGLAFFARRMLQLKPQSSYADVMEQALYNTVLAGMALDGQSFFYVNPLEAVPAACETDARLSHVKPVRQKWFGCACCPPNIARIVSSLGQYIVTQTKDTLYFHLYIGSDLTVNLGGTSMSLRMEADLLKNGDVRISVADGQAVGTLAFRDPAWAGNAQVKIPAGVKSWSENGYLYAKGIWKQGDQITIHFTMPVKALKASPLVKETMGQVCFTRGPLVFCAEEADNGKNLHLLRVLPDQVAEAREKTMLIDGMTLPAMTLPGRRLKEPAANAPLYMPWTPAETEETEITLIPYFAWNNRGKGEMRVWLAE
ncbi:MAG: glycoside hydrolase family 127 protein [Clostridia bacterium]|nr:glycoside hydrolase family 127 protein [Clostridia bacterium]